MMKGFVYYIKKALDLNLNKNGSNKKIWKKQ